MLQVSTVRVSTTSGSQGAAQVGRTQAARSRIIQGGAYTPPAFTSSRVPPYWSPLATHSPTMSGVRSSSPPSHSNNQQHEHHIWPNTNSRRNTATGAEAAVIVRAKTPSAKNILPHVLHTYLPVSPGNTISPYTPHASHFSVLF